MFSVKKIFCDFIQVDIFNVGRISVREGVQSKCCPRPRKPSYQIVNIGSKSNPSFPILQLNAEIFSENPLYSSYSSVCGHKLPCSIFSEYRRKLRYASGYEMQPTKYGEISCPKTSKAVGLSHFDTTPSYSLVQLFEQILWPSSSKLVTTSTQGACKL